MKLFKKGRVWPVLALALAWLPASAAGEAAPAAAPASQPFGGAPTPPADPLEALRQRLAQRLAAHDSGGSDMRLPVKRAPRPAGPPKRRADPGSAAEADPSERALAKPAPPTAAHAPGTGSGHAPGSKGDKTGAAAPAEEAPAHWDYGGSGGPQAWAALNPDFRLCASGRRQSPIDIRGGLAVDLDPVRFDYRPSRFTVIDNGHTVQVNVAPGNTIEVGGRRYELQQFHFHRPAEERIDGRSYEMSLHLVHRDAQGRLLVVALLLEPGLPQPVVQKVWNSLPLERNEEIAARAPLDPGELLPADRGYYTYMGSLTTPPCSEDVQWIVMRQPVTVSPAQIELFARIYPMNARPLQASSGRRILQSQ